jgi:hypothetical protein
VRKICFRTNTVIGSTSGSSGTAKRQR